MQCDFRYRLARSIGYRLHLLATFRFHSSVSNNASRVTRIQRSAVCTRLVSADRCTRREFRCRHARSPRLCSAVVDSRAARRVVDEIRVEDAGQATKCRPTCNAHNSLHTASHATRCTSQHSPIDRLSNDSSFMAVTRRNTRLTTLDCSPEREIRRDSRVHFGNPILLENRASATKSTLVARVDDSLPWPINASSFAQRNSEKIDVQVGRIGRSPTPKRE